MEKNDKIPGGNPFRVPDNYFDEVKREIISATSGGVSQEKKKGIYASLRPYIAIAASVAVLALLGYTGFMTFSHREQETLMLNGVQLESFREAIVYETDISLLEEKAASLDFSVTKPHVDNQDIIDYLVNDNIDINEIYEQL